MILLIFLLNLISYGQIFWMGIWKDDNAIFFKIQHINEAAGFFGKGLIGDSLYRFSFTPYYFVYKLFGVENTLPYYILIFVFYFLASIAIYKLIGKFISKKAGVIAAILFSCGFIGSEGFFWLANAMVSDVAIILASLMIFFYYKYLDKNKLIYYFFAISSYWASAYFVPIRSYYFIGIVLIFEFIFLAHRKFPRSFLISVVRIVPPLLIFRYFFILGGDTRTSGLRDLFSSILNGKFYFTYGMFSSISNVFVADNFSSRFFDIFGRYSSYLTIALSTIVFYLMFRRRRNSKLLAILFMVIVFIWNMLSKSLFVTPVLNLSPTSFYLLFLGGVILLLLFCIYFVINGKYRRKYLFFLLSLLVSIGAYYTYEPLVSLNTTHRYLTGTFFFLIGLASLLFVSFGKKTKAVVIVWGVLNLFNSVIYHHNILTNRSFPVADFYRQLKSELPTINKGDVLYFDLANNNAKSYFNDAISTASMPDETSFAWRYGLDRYDFKIISNFNSLVNVISRDSIDYQRIHGYYYSDFKLEDTTNELRKYLSSKDKFKNIGFNVTTSDGNYLIDFDDLIPSFTPVSFKVTMQSKIGDLSKLSFPYVLDPVLLSNKVALDNELRNEAFDYKRFKEMIMKKSKVVTSSSWMTDITENLLDGNTETNWRANRITWSTEDTYLILDLGRPYDIDRFVWVNGYANSTPTKYSIYTSNDRFNWDKVSAYIGVARIDGKDPQIVSFKSKSARYVKMKIDSTLDQDAPQISEVWVVTSNFSKLNIEETEQFLAEPFGFVGDMNSFENTVSLLGNKVTAKVYWFGNKDNSFVTSFDEKIDLINNWLIRDYVFTIPAGGTRISKIMFKGIQIPVEVSIKKIEYRNLNFKEVFNK